MDLKKLSDQQLSVAMERAVQVERDALSSVLSHMQEVDRRRLYSCMGMASLFDYAVKKLGYSEREAYARIGAMRLLKEIPEMEEKINSGSLSLTNIGLARSLFYQEKKASREYSKKEKLEIVQKMENKTTREAERIIYSMGSRPLSQDKVRFISEEHMEFKFTAPVRVQEKVNKLKALLAHSNPGISMAELMEKLCDLGLQKWDPASAPEKIVVSSGDSACAPTARQERKRSHPKRWKKHGVKNPRYIPAQTKRLVWKRDQGKCQNCESQYALEIDHIKPVAMGGATEIPNLRLLCRNCNQRAAISALGQEKMSRYL